MKVGDKVVFEEATDEQVSWGNNHDPRKYLEPNAVYEIETIDMGAWHTQITLKGFPNLRFNSVSFREVE